MKFIGIAEKKNRIALILQVCDDPIHFRVLLKNDVPYIFEFIKFKFKFVSFSDLCEKVHRRHEAFFIWIYETMISIEEKFKKIVR
jgi:hypothetical protein